MWYHGLSPHKVSCADRSDPPGAAHGGKEALRWIRRDPDLFRLIRITDQLVA